MKIDRLIGIITILLQNEKVTAPELAKRFEVSSRTIHRDVDAICKAGIPIISIPGFGGGLSIASGYKLDKTVLTEKELHAIFTGLKSIDSISRTAYSQGLIEKFSDGKNTIWAAQDKILIDLASWYQDSLPDKIEQLKEAIFNQEIISFLYFSEKGESKRIIEPYLIVFRWSTWYVYGYCLAKNGYRLFKLNRLWQLQNTKTTFQPREISAQEPHFESYFQNGKIKLVALFDYDVKYRLIEEYGIESVTVDDKTGKLLFQRFFSNREYLLQWLLSFGDTVRIIEPPEIQAKIIQITKNILQKYKGT